RPSELAARRERELTAGELDAVDAQKLRLDRIHLLPAQRDRGHEHIVTRVAKRAQKRLAVRPGQLRDGSGRRTQIARLAGHYADVDDRSLWRELAAVAVEDRRSGPELARRAQTLSVAQLPVHDPLAPGDAPAVVALSDRDLVAVGPLEIV